MKCYGAALVLLLAALVSIPNISHAKYLEDGVTYSPNNIVIAIKPQYAPVSPVVNQGIIVTGLQDIDALNRQFEVVRIRPLFPGAEKRGEKAMAGYYSLIFKNTVDLELVLEAYAKLATIEHVEPDGIHRVFYSPNDPSLSSQWALTTIDARQAWDVGRGDSTVILGIADTGVDWDHPDLDGNIWYNFDDPVNGIDDDGNNYIDDIRGWDWVDSPFWPPVDPTDDGSVPDNNPMDHYGHGTHCAGIASAETNNSTGIAGLGFKCSIMCLRIGYEGTDGNGYVQMSYAASAFDYAADNGAKAINCSWGSDNSGGIALAATHASNAGIVIVSAAGNDDNTTAPYLCTRSDVVAVAATDQTDHKATFSNYGSWVDISAPGVNIYSTYFNDTYTYMDGTSMAAPHVVGLVGLIRALAPSMTRAAVITRIENTADDISSLNPGYPNQLGHGRINAASAVAGLGIPVAVPINVSPIAAVWINNPHPTFIWIDTAQATVYHLQVDQQTTFASPDINDSTITDTTYVSPDSLIDGTWYWRTRAGNGTIWTSYTPTSSFKIDTRKPNTAVLVAPAQNAFTNNRRPAFSWQTVTDVGGSGISKYFIQIDTDSLFANPQTVNDSTTITNYTPASNLPADSRIFWRVRARDVAGNFATYASRAFTLDNTAPNAPIGFAITPHTWTTNPVFSLNWTNPTDPSGIVQAFYKVGSVPGSDNDTTGHLSSTPPVSYTALVSGQSILYLWLVDGAGNKSCLNRAQDTIKFDNVPPSGCVASSPEQTNLLNFNVSWSTGGDVGSGLSGIYDVRSRDGSGGTWVDWRIGISGLSSTFSGLNGHTYYFEARARDLAGNLEPFTGAPEAQTLVDTTLIGPTFVPGDANGSGDVNGLDVVYLISYLKGGPPPPDPILRADANGSCSVNGLDVTYLVTFLKGGPPPFAGNCKR